MSYRLLDDRNRHGDHFYTTRRNTLVAIVVHVTAGLEDLKGRDDSAEATARYAGTTEREVSWHSGSDADSCVHLLPPAFTAWHVTGYNSSTYGHEISKADTDWSKMPAGWVDRTLSQAARCLTPIAADAGIPVRHITRGQLDRAIAAGDPSQGGFIGHDVLDPRRRGDPGEDFPWSRFLSLMEDDMALSDDDVERIAKAVWRYELRPDAAEGDGPERAGPLTEWGWWHSREARRLLEKLLEAMEVKL